jgi:hypothetical protein
MSKLTDVEIVKSLESLLDRMRAYESLQASIGKGLVENIISMYNRQKAEIERLQNENKRFADIGKLYSEVRADAIKEFAEKLTNRICENVNRSLDNPNGNNYYPIDVYEDIDNLVKEMVGESNAQFTMQNSQLELLREKCIEHQDFHKGDDGVFRAYISIEDLDRIVDELEVRSQK